MQLGKSLMTNLTHIKSIRLQFFVNFSISLLLAKKTLLNFENAQATSSGDSTNQLTRSQSRSICFLHSLVKYLGTFVEKLTAITLSIYGKWPSKLQIVKEKTSLTLPTSTTIPLNCRTSKVARGSKPLVPSTLYVLELQEPSQTMPLQENINYNFSWRKTSSVCAVYILLRQEGTFCMNVRDIRGIGTLKETCSIILSCSWVLIPWLSPLLTIYFQLLQVDLRVIAFS